MDKKKAKQLGMNPSTASNRLVKDLLFRFGAESLDCYRCGEELERENFSIDHKVPWLDSDDPLGLYFDLENVTFSHKDCNRAAARNGQTITAGHGTTGMYRKRGCRCDQCTAAQRIAASKLRTSGRTAKERA